MVITACILVVLVLMAGAVAAVVTATGFTPATCGALGRLGPANDTQRHCYAVTVHRLVEQEGPVAVTTLERIGRTDPVLHDACHRLMHAEGRLVGERLDSRERVRTTMATVDQREAGTCGAGMRHGIFEGYVERHGLSSSDSSAFVIMCGKVRQRLARYDCAHGLGHAATRVNHLAIEPSMRFCGSMPHPDAEDCGSAVLMTMAEGVLLDGGPMSKLRSGRELAGYCQSVPRDARTPCYRWIPLTPAFSKRLGPSDITAACSSAAPGSIERTTCFVGMGRQARGEDPRSCDGLPDDAAHAACSYGLLVGWVINRVDQPAAAAGKHCAEQQAGLARNACFLALGRVSMAFHEHANGLDGRATCQRGLVGVASGDLAGAMAWCRRGVTLVPAPLDYSAAEHAALLAVAAS